jgi:DNA modification methylase
VLKKDGTCWINLGDSYAGSWGAMSYAKGDIAARRFGGDGDKIARPVTSRLSGSLKAKDLIGIPWRVAFALQESGWWLRQDIIWSKPNPMPESVTDRCTKAHEYIFLLTKSAKYYYNAEAIKEPLKDASIARLIEGSPVKFGGNKYGDNPDLRLHSGNEWKPKGRDRSNGNRNGEGASTDADGVPLCGVMANKKSVWTVTTRPFKEAHFATFPEALITPCILAGSRPGGIIYDPFGGAGTSAVVSHKLGRRWILSELNPEYVAIANKRLEPLLRQSNLFT